MKNPVVLICLLICVSLTSCKPFLISLLSNQNVYKTKDKLELKRVYDLDNKTAVNDNVVYTLEPQDAVGGFLRYKIVKEGVNPYIYILPSTKFENSTSIKGLQVGDTEHVNEYYYQFVNEAAKLSPSVQYLATEHITAMPLTIPIKIRLDVPETLNAITLSPAISYAFGYKIRTNNNPFKDHFLRLNPLVIGFSAENYLPDNKVSDPDYESKASVALNLATGLTFETNKFNLGAFIGWDRMFGSRTDWVYQKKAWLGIGFGYKFETAK